MTDIIPSTTARVPQSTAEDVNRHIYNDTRPRVNAYASEGPQTSNAVCANSTTNGTSSGRSKPMRP